MKNEPISFLLFTLATYYPIEGAIQGRENRRIRFGLVIGWCSQGLLPLDDAPLTATTLGDRLNVSSFSTSISDWLTN